MDYCNLDLEVADTLNYLRPPVLRGFRKTCKESHRSFSFGCPKSPNLLQDYRSKVSKHYIRIPVGEASSSIATEISSSSAIYKKPNEEKALKKISVLSYTNFQHSRKTSRNVQPNSAKQKPLIQVTVIPKQSDYRNSLKLRKRVHPKPPHITVSNQENSTKTSETYCLVSGRKNERVYEIKTTSSAEVASSSYVKNERVSVDEVKHFKQLLDFLNMDKKKRKWKKQKEDAKLKKGGGKNADEDKETRGSFAGRDFAISGDECPAYCSHPCASKRGSRDGNDLNSRKSRVRITGRIGLTEDDQYVLRCAATVDDKPVLTNVAQIPLPPDVFHRDFKLPRKDVSSFEKENNDYRRERRSMKDSNVQANFHVETSYDRARTSQSPGFSKNAQFETKDDYNTVTLSNIETLKIVSNKNANIQMNGPGEISNMGYRSEGNNKYDGSQYPNCCSNPLVIISVYPKQGAAEKQKAEKSAGKDSGYKSPTTTNVLNASQKTRTSVGAKPKIEKDTWSPTPRSTRPPSPTRSSSPSPISSPTRKQPKVKNSIAQTDSKTGKAKKKESAVQTPTNNKMPQRKGPQKDSGQNSPRKFGSQAKATGKKPGNENSASQAKNQQTSADVQMTKKALVDTYTKKITEQMDKNAHRRYPAKNDVSNVTINIEGEHEFYDLMFHQGNQTTDLRVRRSVKEQGSQMHGYDSPSLENFLLTEDYPDPAARKRSFSQTFYEQSNDDLVLQTPTQSRLNVRDSIEISHRREKSCADALQTTGSGADLSKPCRNLSRDSFGIFYEPESAEQPVKHFQGDNCSIFNPIERDKEIRRLLGVKRSWTKQTTAQAEVKSGIRFNIQPNYNYWCDSDKSNSSEKSLLREIGDSLDSYNNLSTSKSFEEQMGVVYNASAICADCTCQTPKECATKYENETYETREPRPCTLEQQVKNDRIEADLEFRPQRHFPHPPLTQIDESHIQMVLNRSINIFIEMKKFSNQKPIVLSRKQYEKVKKAIDGGLSFKKNSPRAWFNHHWRSGDSTGATSTKQNWRSGDSTGGASTNQHWRSGDSVVPGTYSRRSDEPQRTTVHKPMHQTTPEMYNKRYDEIQDTTVQKLKHQIKDQLDETNDNNGKDTQSDDPCSPDKSNIQYCNQHVALPGTYHDDPQKIFRTCYYCGRPQSELNNYCYFCGMYLSVDEAEKLFYQTPEALPSSSSKIASYTRARPMEIRYSFAYVEFSSSNAEVQTPVPPPPSISSDSKSVERSDSILTIFKGRRRKSVTPNLGTSINSLSTSKYSDDLSASLGGERSHRPLFRRLMSCLVMRSARATPLKLAARPLPRTDLETSADSYHISTSLGAIELGSSLYDTSVSFYSNHSIHPITSKTRRGGFLRSIRSYLASRKTSPFKKEA